MNKPTGTIPAPGGTNVPAALLRRAARAMETGEIRWGRGDFIDQTGCRCALGAITYAADPADRADGNPRHITDDVTRIHATLAARALAEWITDRLDAVPAYTDGDLDAIETVGEWNDRAATTVDDVIEAMTDAAGDYERQASW